jgi:predicted dienelactone hydrolase
MLPPMWRQAAMAGVMLAAWPVRALPVRAAPCDAVLHDGPRGRDVPVRIDLPAGDGAVPGVIWSPGLGGGRGNAARWVAAWTAAGIAVIRLEHPGSDAHVYAGQATPEQRAARVREGASPPQLLARIGDVGLVLDTLARAPQLGGCATARIDRDRLALAGHSMGAWVVQAMAGQRPDGITAPVVDRRLRAFIAISSTGPIDAAAARTQFGGIAAPLLVITGSMDGVPPGAAAAFAADQRAARASLFSGAPADGRKALLVVTGADHLLFAGDVRDAPAQAAMQARVARLTTSWLRRWLLGDAGPLPAPAAGDQWAVK